jgi:hypothetical protein
LIRLHARPRGATKDEDGRGGPWLHREHGFSLTPHFSGVQAPRCCALTASAVSRSAARPPGEAVETAVQPSSFDRPAGESPASVKMIEPSSHSRLDTGETRSRASSAVNGPGRGRKSPVVGPEVLTTRRAATLSECCCLVKTAHMNPIRVEQLGGRTASRLVKAPIPGDGNSDGVRAVARREGRSRQRREGDWRGPEGTKTGRYSRKGKPPGAPETGGSGRSSQDGRGSNTLPEPRACGSASGSTGSGCKAMAPEGDKNAWTDASDPESAEERSNARPTERKGRSGVTDFQPYWGKPTVRNEWRGQGKREPCGERALALLDFQGGIAAAPEAVETAEAQHRRVAPH